MKLMLEIYICRWIVNKLQIWKHFMISNLFQIWLFCSEVWMVKNIKINYIKLGHFSSVELPSGSKKDHPLSLNVRLLLSIIIWKMKSEDFKITNEKWTSVNYCFFY